MARVRDACVLTDYEDAAHEHGTRRVRDVRTTRAGSHAEVMHQAGASVCGACDMGPMLRVWSGRNLLRNATNHFF
jgi:hypothetical protein|eukprot:2298760-Prymnesium_polylepis.1